MKKIISILTCLIFCILFTGCGMKQTIEISFDGGINFSDSTDNVSLNQLEENIKRLAFKKGEQTLFENFSITENKGIFYNSYRFSAITYPQESTGKVIINVSMPGKPSSVRNGIIQEKEVIFPLTELAESIELVAEFEENNIGIIIVIIALLFVIMTVFYIFLKRGGGGMYDIY